MTKRERPAQTDRNVVRKLNDGRVWEGAPCGCAWIFRKLRDETDAQGVRVSAWERAKSYSCNARGLEDFHRQTTGTDSISIVPFPPEVGP